MGIVDTTTVDATPVAGEAAATGSVLAETGKITTDAATNTAIATPTSPIRLARTRIVRPYVTGNGGAHDWVTG